MLNLKLFLSPSRLMRNKCRPIQIKFASYSFEWNYFNLIYYFLNFSFNAFSTFGGTKSDISALYCATSFTTLELIKE